MELFKLVDSPKSSFPIPTSTLKIQIDPDRKALVIEYVESNLSRREEYALEDLSQAERPCLFMDRNSGRLLVQHVDFLGRPLYSERIPLNDNNQQPVFKVNAGGGWVGSLDIRDIQGVVLFNFDFNQVPLMLHIDRNYLVLSMPECIGDEKQDCWYSNSSTK